MSKPDRHTWLWIVVICALALLLRLPALEMPIDNDGGARAYHARLILNGEPLYSSHHTGHHLPAIYYTYAAALFLFGDSPWAIQFLLLLWTIPTVYLLYRVGADGANEGVGRLAAVFYAILSSHVWLWGQTAETELFANLPRITAVWLLLYLLKTEAPTWKFIFMGLLGAITFLFKAVYVSPLVLAGVALLIDLIRHKRWRPVLARGAWITVGFLVGLLPVLLYFGSLGLLPRLFEVFALGQTQVTAPVVDSDALPVWLLYPLLPLFSLGLNNAVLLIFSLAALVLIGLRERSSPLIYLAVWYLLSFGEAAVNLEPFAHYYLLIVPALSLLAAWFVVKIYQDMRQSPGRQGAAAAVFTLLLLAALGTSLVQNGPYYSHYLRYKGGQIAYEEAVQAGWPGFGERLIRAQELAAYIAARTETADRIFYWSEDVQLYYLAQRRSPIDMIWPRKVAVTAEPAAIFGPQTKYVLIDRYREREPAIPAWLLAAVAEQYTLETVIDEQEIYRRK